MQLTLRQLARADLPQLSSWLEAPHVKRWWREPADASSVEDAYGPAIDGADPTELLIAELDGRAIGMLQRYRLADNPHYERALEPSGVPRPAAGLDYLIGERALTGRGLGPLMIARASADTWTAYPEIAAIVVAVQIGNRPSWRALETAGYRRAWSGFVDSGDPSDDGPSHLYVLNRPTVSVASGRTER
ncbi:MAG TPA: GNAT family N-acetyltransferase [Solirubrobacteraceae bacterium]|nr:GNAT family N-acetyltransferase [Solirubrobacteraceae bacterium]